MCYIRKRNSSEWLFNGKKIISEKGRKPSSAELAALQELPRPGAVPEGIPGCRGGGAGAGALQQPSCASPAAPAQRRSCRLSPRSSFRRAVWSGVGWVWVRDVAAEIKLPSAEGVWREGDCGREGWGLGYPRPPAWEDGCFRVGWAPAGVWVLPRPWGGQPTAGHPQLTRARAKGPFLAPLLGGDCLICCCFFFFF